MEQAPDSVTEHTNKPIDFQRAPIWDILLIFSSMTILIPFYIIGQVRSLKKLANADAIPWLWFFVPFNPLFLFFGLFRLSKHLRQYEMRYEKDPKPVAYFFWALACFVSVGLLNVKGIEETENLALLSGLIVSIGLVFPLFSYFTSELKKEDPRVVYRRGKHAYRWWEWVIIVVGFPISIFLHGALLYEHFDRTTTRSLTNVRQYQSDTVPITFELPDGRWYQADEETLGNGQIIGFENEGRTLAVRLFQYDKDVDIQTILASRYLEVANLSSTIQCADSLKYSASANRLSGHLECNSPTPSEFNHYRVSAIEVAGNYYELFIEFTELEEHQNEASKIADSFHGVDK